MSKKNKRSVEQRAADKNVAPQNVFIVSKAQGFEVDAEDNLITKVSVIDYNVVKASTGETFIIQIDGFLLSALFKDKIRPDLLKKGKMYVALELPGEVFNTEINLAVLAKGEAVVLADKNSATKPLEIVELDKG